MRASILLGLAACGTAPPTARASLANVATGPTCLPVANASWLEAERAGSILRVCSVQVVYSEHDNGDEAHRDKRLACIGVVPDTGALVRQPDQLSASHDDDRGYLESNRACSAAHVCRPIGPQLAADLGEHASVSGDGALVGTEQGAWDVATDRELALAPPGDMDSSAHVSFGFRGQLIVGGWTPCAGPCTVTRVFRRDGTVIGGDLDMTGDFVALDRDRIATFDGGELDVYDVRQAKRVLTMVLPGATPGQSIEGVDMPPPLVALPGDRVASAWNDGDATAIAIIDLARGGAARSIRVPSCR